MPDFRFLNNNFDACIIGGGVSGLTAAILLSRQGLKIALVEAAPRLGPCIRGFKRYGMYFNMGVHLLSWMEPGQVLHRYLEHLGLMDHLRRLPVEPSGYLTVRIQNPDSTLTMPCGFDAVAKLLISRFPAESGGIKKFLN